MTGRLILAALVLALSACTADERAAPAPAAPASPSVADVGPSRLPSPLPSPSPDLEATYLACARAAGFDPGFAQVLRWEPPPSYSPSPADPMVRGVPYWVKTARDVPAAVHGPCLVRIGGRDPGASSYGHRADDA